MDPAKQQSLPVKFEEQPQISDIFNIVQKLNNCNRSLLIAPYSDCDPESIFPQSSQISINSNEDQSEKSKINNFGGIFKRIGVSQSKEENSIPSKHESLTKKVKKIQVFSKLKQEEVSKKSFILNEVQQLPNPNQYSKFTLKSFFLAKKLAPKINLFKTNSLEMRQKQKIQNFSQEGIENDFIEHKSNGLTTSLLEKNADKRRNIQELKKQLNLIKARKQSMKANVARIKQEQKQSLKLKLKQTNQTILRFQRFKSDVYLYLNEQNIGKSLLPSVEVKLKNLDSIKKKASKKGGTKKQMHTDEESIPNACEQLDCNQAFHQFPDKKNYINQWMSKLQKFKERLENDKNYYQKLYKTRKRPQQIPEDIKQVLQANVFLKDYVLFFIEYPLAQTKSNLYSIAEVNTFNTENLRHEIITLLKYPKPCCMVIKHSIQQQLQKLFKLSKKLHNSGAFYFNSTTIALQLGQDNELIVYGRQKNQESENLIETIHKYETFSEVMIRYIARICLIVLEEVKVKVDVPVFLLPSNIFFTQKCQIKFSNLLLNNLFLHDEFRPYLKENKMHYFVSPQAFSQRDLSNLPAWSLGVLLYYLVYEKYPFTYEWQDQFLKQTFFIYNQLTFPVKPVINEKLKDFIAVCLISREKDVGQLQKHILFSK